MESDSQIIINIVKGKINITWQLQDSIDTINCMLTQTTNIVQQCYREANQIVDALAKWSMEGHKEFFYEVKDLSNFRYNI